MPPVVAITAWAVSENSPAASRADASPRLTALGASTVPATPVTAPSVGDELVDAVAEAQLDQPARGGLAHAALERRHDARGRCPR